MDMNVIVAGKGEEILTLTETKATTRAATSLSMWKLSATRAIELVM